MESGAILESQISASSVFSITYAAHRARLNFKTTASKIGSWSAGLKDINQWLQVDLLLRTEVTCIATQGRDEMQQWVTKYKLQYGDDGDTFKFYKQIGDDSDMV